MWFIFDKLPMNVNYNVRVHVHVTRVCITAMMKANFGG